VVRTAEEKRRAGRSREILEGVEVKERIATKDAVEVR
jgi:hypothetical protein